MALSDSIFKGTVTVLMAITVVGGIGVSMSMVERFSFLRQQKPVIVDGAESQQQ